MKQNNCIGSNNTTATTCTSNQHPDAGARAPRAARSGSAAEPAAPATARADTRGCALTLYYREIGAIPLLTREEEMALAARVRQGDEAAREQMIKANLRLVVTIARGFEGYGVPLLDLINEGNIGLMKGVERFEPERGAKLSVYASFWIKQHIRRAIGNQGRTVRLPIHIQEKMLALGRIALRLHEELGREPTEEEISAECGLPAAKVRRWRAAVRATLSLDAPLDGDQSGPMSEIIPDERARKPDEVLAYDVESRLLAEFLPKLPDRERRVLEERFGLSGDDEKTLMDLGERMGLTRERIRQLQEQAIARLRKMFARRDAIQLVA